jgi:hypothetical protein
MYGELGRVGVLGNIVTFRMEGTEELLWKAPMQFVPRMDELVGLLENSEVATWYKVEAVKYELRYEELDAGGGEIPEVPELAPYADCAVTVFVSAV